MNPFNIPKKRERPQGSEAAEEIPASVTKKTRPLQQSPSVPQAKISLVVPAASRAKKPPPPSTSEKAGQSSFIQGLMTMYPLKSKAIVAARNNNEQAQWNVQKQIKPASSATVRELARCQIELLVAACSQNPATASAVLLNMLDREVVTPVVESINQRLQERKAETDEAKVVENLRLFIAHQPGASRTKEEQNAVIALLTAANFQRN